MANMSYCRFQNTRLDLMDCLEAIDNGEELSSEEYRAAVSMFKSVLEFLYDNNVVLEYDADNLESMLEYLCE